jgi:hypothetical protein
MTVSTTLVSAVSHGQIVVSDSLPFTTAIYNLLVVDAKSLLDQEETAKKGILPTNIYDRLQALLICHLWEGGDPVYALSSYHSGDYSHSLKDAGMTVYMVQYLSILQKWSQQSTPQAESSVQRADCDMGLAQLDPNSIIKPWNDGTNPNTTNPWGIQGG